MLSCMCMACAMSWINDTSCNICSWYATIYYTLSIQYVIKCHVIPRHTMSCILFMSLHFTKYHIIKSNMPNKMSNSVTSCNVMSHLISSYVTLCHTKSYTPQKMSHNKMLCHTMSHHAMSCHTVSLHMSHKVPQINVTQLHAVTQCHIMQYHVTQYLFVCHMSHKVTCATKKCHTITWYVTQC